MRNSMFSPLFEHYEELIKKNPKMLFNFTIFPIFLVKNTRFFSHFLCTEHKYSPIHTQTSGWQQQKLKTRWRKKMEKNVEGKTNNKRKMSFFS